MSGVASRAVRLLMVGPLLFTGVPAWQHSHAAGNRPHSHAHDHDGFGESHAHLHVTLFGVEFTLPVESDDDDSDEGQSTFLVAAPTAIDPGQSLLHFAALVQPILNVGEPLQIESTFRCITASAAPLCDTARHERSGVQLI